MGPLPRLCALWVAAALWAALAAATDTALRDLKQVEGLPPATGPSRRPTEPPPQHELLRYKVDLAADPATRFSHVWADFLAKRGHTAFAQTYQAWAQWGKAVHVAELHGSVLCMAVMAALLEALRAAHPETVAEMAALSRALQEAVGGTPDNFRLPTLATLALLYPIANIAPASVTATQPSACTSTLVRRSDGSLLHGRSLDYEPRDPLANATVVIDFHRGGRPAYSCLHALPYPTAVQWFTCVRPGAFSLSVNARSQGLWMERNTSFTELLRRIGRPGTLLLGEVAEKAMQAETFDAALVVLALTPVVSSNYFILAGADGRGAIVTRYGNSSSADVWPMGPQDGPEVDGQPPWLRVQTNVDHGVPFASGAYATHRRQRVIELLSSLGQKGIDRDSLLKVYLTDHARVGSENRTQPEDTGVILRPSTIATLVLDPSATEPEPDLRYWRVWSQSPVIGPAVPEAGAVRPTEL